MLVAESLIGITLEFVPYAHGVDRCFYTMQFYREKEKKKQQ